MIFTIRSLVPCLADASARMCASSTSWAWLLYGLLDDVIQARSRLSQRAGGPFIHKWEEGTSGGTRVVANARLKSRSGGAVGFWGYGYAIVGQALLISGPELIIAVTVGARSGVFENAFGFGVAKIRHAHSTFVGSWALKNRIDWLWWTLYHKMRKVAFKNFGKIKIWLSFLARWVNRNLFSFGIFYASLNFCLISWTQNLVLLRCSEALSTQIAISSC